MNNNNQFLSDEDMKELSKSIRKIFFLVLLQGNIRRGALCMIISLSMLNCMLV
jgi:hypothetical protein